MPTPDMPVAWLDFDGLIAKLEEAAATYPPEDKSLYRFLPLPKHHNQKHAQKLSEIRGAITEDAPLQLKEAQLLLALHEVLTPIEQSTLLLKNIKDALILYPPFQTLNGQLPAQKDDESDDKYVTRLSASIYGVSKDELRAQCVKMADLRGVKFKTDSLVQEVREVKMKV